MAPSGESLPPIFLTCGVDSDGNIDYTQHGDNWCDMCADGKKQSPINLNIVNLWNPPIDIKVDIIMGELHRLWVDVSQNWVRLRFRSEGYLRIEGTDLNKTDVYYVYKPTGVMEFHTPAEHTYFDGSRYDVELVVHWADKDGNLAETSFFFDHTVEAETTNNDLMDLLTNSDFIDSLALDSPGHDMVGKLNGDAFQKMLETVNMGSLWLYDGSMTYPPCTEGVKHMVFLDPKPISNKQLELLKSFFDDNYRMTKENENQAYLLQQVNLAEMTCGPCS